MKKILFVIAIMFVATNVYAERWIQCVDVTIGPVSYQKPLRFEGDCLQLGLCSGPNNTGIAANTFEAKGSEWNDARGGNAKCALGASEGNRITELTAQELADIQAAQQAQADSAVREAAKNGFDGVSNESLKLKAMVEVLISEINILRQAIEDITLESNQLTDKNLPDRTLSQAKVAIKNKIDSGDVDND